MIKFYTNREMAEKFHVNLARWKRWSREFLPPDPLGGLQSGYARQYNPNEAFMLYLAGHLVGEMKFSIPETRQVLNIVQPWLLQHGFLRDFAGTVKEDPRNAVFSAWQLVIAHGRRKAGAQLSLTCLARGMEASAGRRDFNGRRRCWVEFPIGPGDEELNPDDIASYRVLNISVLHRKFLAALKTEND